MKLSKLQKDNFQKFLVKIDFIIEDLNVLVSSQLKKKQICLDFSEGSIVTLDSILNEYNEGNVFKETNKNQIITMLSVYYGETFIKNVGGYWILSNQKNSTFGTPVIGGYAKKGIIQAPFLLITNVIGNKQKNALIAAFKSGKKSAERYDKSSSVQ